MVWVKSIADFQTLALMVLYSPVTASVTTNRSQASGTGKPAGVAGFQQIDFTAALLAYSLVRYCRKRLGEI